MISTSTNLWGQIMRFLKIILHLLPRCALGQSVLPICNINVSSLIKGVEGSDLCSYCFQITPDLGRAHRYVPKTWSLIGHNIHKDNLRRQQTAMEFDIICATPSKIVSFHIWNNLRVDIYLQYQSKKCITKQRGNSVHLKRKILSRDLI